MGLAKDVSSYNESSLRRNCVSLRREFCSFETPQSSSGEQRGGSPYASRKPPRCHESRICAGLLEADGKRRDRGEK